MKVLLVMISLLYIFGAYESAIAVVLHPVPGGVAIGANGPKNAKKHGEDMREKHSPVFRSEGFYRFG